jgi:hypothetical protein
MCQTLAEAFFRNLDLNKPSDARILCDIQKQQEKDERRKTLSQTQKFLPGILSRYLPGRSRRKTD